MSQYWHACFTDHNGVQRQRSTKTTNKVDAMRMADLFEESFRRQQTESQMRRVLSDFHEVMHGTPMRSLSFKAFVEEWLANIKHEVKPGTYSRYGDAWKMLLGTVPNTKKSKDVLKLRIDDVSTEQLTEIRNKMAESCAASTVNTNFKIFRIMFRAAFVSGLITLNPAVPIKNIHRGVSDGEPRRPFTIAEMKILLAEANEEWRDIILTAFYTGGPRLQDVVRLTCSSVNLANKIVSFVSEKTGRQTIVPLGVYVLPVIKRRIEGKKPSAPLFPVAFSKLRKDGNGTVSVLSGQFGRILYRAGLRDNPSKARAKIVGRRGSQPLSFHSLRHTATSILKNAGIGQAIVMDIVGHDSEAVSSNYTHIDEAAKREALAKLPDLT